MDNTINNDIIEKVTIKSVAIYKAIGMLSPIETKDLWEEKNSIEHQKNYENKNVSGTNDTTKDTKKSSMPNDWRDITDPKLRKKMRKRENDKRYREKFKDKVKLKKKIYRERNKENLKSYFRKYRKVNKLKLQTYHQRYFQQNKDTVYKSRNDRVKTDIQFKLNMRLRSRLNCALRGNYKNGSAVRDLGCTIDELKSYLESKFQSGMTWDNWTSEGWHIDHIKPLSSFDLTDRKQLLEACHYTNLQPLWAKDNLSKSDKI